MRRMLLLFMFLPMFIWGQNFSFTPEHTDITGSPGDEIIFDFEIKNETDSRVEIYILRTNENAPEGWTIPLCFEFCLRPDIDSVGTVLEPNQVSEFSVHFFTNNNEGSGAATIIAADLNNPSESYTIHLTAKTTVTSVEDDLSLDTYYLKQNYPNPFNPTTQISYGLANAGNVSIIVYDVLGNEVSSLVNEYKTSGKHVAMFNASQLGSGVYFYQIITTGFKETRKMILTK